MSLICPRCQYGYAVQEHEGMPICSSCFDKIQQGVEKKLEPKRQCPVDLIDMDKIFVKNVMIDKCPKCRGIWLDGDELNLIKQTCNDGSGDFIYGVLWGAILF